MMTWREPRRPCLLLLLLLLLLTAAGGVSASDPSFSPPSSGLEDHHAKCKAWSFLGECELNSGYMLKNCAASCQLYEEALLSSTPQNLHSITEIDFHGNKFHYRDYKGKVLFIVNAAAMADDPLTDANYRLLATLSKFRSDTFEIILFPSFQFEKNNRDPYFVSFYAQQSGFEGVIMRHGELNGIGRFDTFKYLLGKEVRGSTMPIRGNFHAKLFVDNSGYLDAEGSQLATGLFSVARSSSLSVEAASQVLMHDGEGGVSPSMAALDPRDIPLIEIVRDLGNKKLCPWFGLYAEECGQLKMQLLLDVY